MAPTTSGLRDPRWLGLYARFLVLSVLLLLVAGAMVTSTGSGLAVPDWPLSFGQLMPPMEGGVLYEHGHRMVATLVGLLTIGLAAWVSWLERRTWVRRLTWIALGMIILQGFLGGATVLLRLPVWTSAAHACLAQGFFLVVILLALALSPPRASKVPPPPSGAKLRTLSLFTTITIFGQLVIGALMRHMHAGLAIPDFPTAFGGLFPPSWTPQIGIHYAHRVGAFVTAVMVMWTMVVALRLPAEQRAMRRPTAAMGFLVLLQVFLGGSIVWTGRDILIATAHVVVGALLLGASWILTVRTRGSLGDLGEASFPLLARKAPA